MMLTEQLPNLVTGSTSLLDSARSFVGNQVNKIQEATKASTPVARGAFNILSGIEEVRNTIRIDDPNLLVDKLVSGNPALKDFGNIVKSDKNLGIALRDAVRNDDTFLPGLHEMAASKDGVESLSRVTEQLKDPSLRKLFTTSLRNVADKKEVDFSHVKGAALAIGQYDILDMEKSDERLLSSFEGLGIPRAESESVLNGAKQNNFLKALSDGTEGILSKPGKLAGMFTKMMDGMGLSRETTNGFIGIIGGLITGLKAIFDPKGDFLGHYVKGFSKMFAGVSQYGETLNTDAPPVPQYRPKAESTVSVVPKIKQEQPYQPVERTGTTLDIGNKIKTSINLTGAFDFASVGKPKDDAAVPAFVGPQRTASMSMAPALP